MGVFVSLWLCRSSIVFQFKQFWKDVLMIIRSFWTQVLPILVPSFVLWRNKSPDDFFKKNWKEILIKRQTICFVFSPTQRGGPCEGLDRLLSCSPEQASTWPMIKGLFGLGSRVDANTSVCFLCDSVAKWMFGFSYPNQQERNDHTTSISFSCCAEELHTVGWKNTLYPFQMQRTHSICSWS